MAENPPAAPAPRPAAGAGRRLLTIPRPTWLAGVMAVLAVGLPGVRVRTSAEVDERNAHRLYADVLWSSVFAAIAAFNGAFAVRLGASNELIGLLSSAPPLVVALLTMPMGELVERSTRRVRMVALSVLAHRTGFLLVALLPFVFAVGRAEAFVGVLVLMTVPAALVGIAFNSTFADVVPESRRAAVISVRSIIASAIVMALTPLVGRWLDLVSFPANYQVVYLVGFLTSLFAVRALGQIEAPARASRLAASSGEKRWPLRVGAAKRLFAENVPFARITLDTLVHGCGAWLVSPLYIIYYVRVLGASDQWIGALTAVGSLTAMAGYYVWHRIIVRWGEDLPLRLTILLTGLFPVAVGLSGSLGAILVFAGVNGLVQPGLAVSHFNTLLRTCPEGRRPTYLAIFTTIMNVGAFVFPMVGVTLAGWVGINQAMFAGAGLWLIGGVLFSLLPVRPEPTKA